MTERKKISVVGAGRVGSTAAQLIAYKELGDLVLVNRTEGKAKGIALDLSASGPVEDFDVSIIGTSNFAHTKNSDVAIITAGIQRKQGMSRDELLQINAKIVSHAAQQIAKYSPQAILICVSNPVDIMTFVALKASRFKKQRVMGMAGILDTSRFQSFIAQEARVSAEDVSALVLGNHGDSMLPLVDYASVHSVPLTKLLPKSKIQAIVKRTRFAGAEIIKLEKDSSAYYAPGSAIVQMVESIIHDKKRILPCCAYLNGQFGISGVFMGVPVKLGGKGIEQIIEIPLKPQEKNILKQSAKKAKTLIQKVNVRA